MLTLQTLHHKEPCQVSKQFVKGKRRQRERGGDVWRVPFPSLQISGVLLERICDPERADSAARHPVLEDEMVPLKQDLMIILMILMILRHKASSHSHLPILRGAEPRPLPGEVGEGEVAQSRSECPLTGEVGQEVLSPHPAPEINES